MFTVRHIKLFLEVLITKNAVAQFMRETALTCQVKHGAMNNALLL